MGMDLTGITNVNEYYTNHYLASVFEENVGTTISSWRAEAKSSEKVKRCGPDCGQFYTAHDRFQRSRFDLQTLANIAALADAYLASLDYPAAAPLTVSMDDEIHVPVYLEIKKNNGAPLLWVLLAASVDPDTGVMECKCFPADVAKKEENLSAVPADILTGMPNEELANKILFAMEEPPRWLLFIGMNQIALIDRNKWNEKRYLQFELETIFSRREETTLQAMAVLLHKDSLCPLEGKPLLDELDESSQKNASGVS